MELIIIINIRKNINKKNNGKIEIFKKLLN